MNGGDLQFKREALQPAFRLLATQRQALHQESRGLVCDIPVLLRLDVAGVLNKPATPPAVTARPARLRTYRDALGSRSGFS